jgi:nicotinamide-nucleotide amidase
MTTAAIVTIGDEILYGHITDTNSTYIAALLSDNGISTIKKITIGDASDAITEVLTELSNKVDIVIITGGLGPTKDDITKNTLANFFNCELELNAEALKHVQEFFAKRNKHVTESNILQAHLPSKAEYIPNKLGTAPGMWFNKNNQAFISLPGVPFEMKAIMTNEIIPRIITRYKTSVISHQIIKTFGIGESFLAEKIADWENQLPDTLKLAYLPEIGQVKLRLSTSGSDIKHNKELISKHIRTLQPIISEYIFAYSDISLAEAVGNILLDQKQTLATAESCTGGAIAAAITCIAGSSAYFRGSVVAYQNDIKRDFLNVKAETLNKFGAVSKETVEEMAIGVRKKMNTTFGLSSSGIAGPGGGSAEKPVGTVWIACSDQSGTISQKLELQRDRKMNIQHSVLAALNLLKQRITQNS